MAQAIKYLVWAAVGALAAFRPGTGKAVFARIERLGRRLSSHRIATWLMCGLLVLLIRGALLPFWPPPKPVIYDEFGYILQADTFASGRLTNPTHKLWRFFESPYILERPTYAAKYPPGQGLAMAAGQALFDDPWFGVWLSCAAMAAAIAWALQGWMPPPWALLGGILTLPLAIDSYWMNSYWGGAVAAIGGALLLGGYARVVRRRQVWYALAMGLGLSILANTRPFEGLIFGIPILVAFFRSRPRWMAAGLIGAVLIPAAIATGLYNRAVTGSAFRMPFTEYAKQYARIPLFSIQPLQPDHTYLSTPMRDLHENWERTEWQKARGWQLIPARFADWTVATTTLFGSVLLGPVLVLFLRHLWRDRRMRLPVLCLLVALIGSFLEIRYYTHYAGPVTVAAFIGLVQVIRHLRQWNAEGLFLSRVLPIVVVLTALFTQSHTIDQPRVALRDQVAAGLANDPAAQHVVLVRYSGHQSPHEEWVYNSANIDGQSVIWAHDLGEPANVALVDYYKDRKIWRLDPDVVPLRLEPYMN